ncbi:MAG: formylglycine-generating enzyme family protein [Candidatus Riflebacteria bacterium]|nr:formylglycine-generating enzyme family protein [Candidatus Riflebacteria bacterium]
MRRMMIGGLVMLGLVVAGGAVAAPPTDDRALVEEYRRDLEDRFTNTVGMEFVYLRPGRFVMGSAGEGAEPDEQPAHEVTVGRGFYLGVTEVTQAQFTAVMGYNPSLFQDPDRPVEKVAWLEAAEFVRKLNEKEGTTRYALPTEIEWEYACRAGADTAWYWGDAFDDRFAWGRANAEGQTHPVATRLPNAWGLHDMAGNVSEWCADLYGLYPGSSMEPPAVDEHPTYVTRGGSWASREPDLRCANRSRLWHHYRLSLTGFRVKALPLGEPAR